MIDLSVALIVPLLAVLLISGWRDTLSALLFGGSLGICLSIDALGTVVIVVGLAVVYGAVLLARGELSLLNLRRKGNQL